MTNKLITEAKAKEKNGDILGAIALYKVAWREDSKNIFLQIEIGNLYAIIEEYEEAECCSCEFQEAAFESAAEAGKVMDLTTVSSKKS